MSPRSAQHRSALLLVALLLASTLALAAPVASQTASLQPHAPILIDGDADLCNEADVKAGVDQDGIINCETADGSPDAPYLIAGWRVQQSIATCAPPLITCGPPPCSVSTAPAAVAICNTAKHIVLQGVDIENAERTREPGGRVASAGLLLSGASNVRVHGVNITALGIGLSIVEGRNAESELTATNLTLTDVTVLNPAQPSLTDPNFPLVFVADADVQFVRLNVMDGQRNVLMEVVTDQDLDEQPLHRLSLLRSTIRGGIEAGLSIQSYDAKIADSIFQATGPPLGQSDSNSNLAIATSRYQLINNSFDIANIGIYIEDARGRMQFNRFHAIQEARNPWAIRQPAGVGCVSGPITYNEFWANHVENDGTACTLSVPYNYWEGGPDTSNGAGQASRGNVAVDPVLPLPLAELPAVQVDNPRPGTGIHGKFIVEGTADPKKGGTLQRIEATDVEDAWTANTTADGTSKWTLSWDATTAPLGAYKLWVRACGSIACGVPVALDLQVVERPLPPIALLVANPRIAGTGAIITLDASASYSPHARPISLYRFDLGNGARSEWTSNPTYEVRYTVSGEYPTSVEVIDIVGLQNTNLPQAIVRIRDAGDDDPGKTGVPGPSGPLCGLALLLGVALLRRRA